MYRGHEKTTSQSDGCRLVYTAPSLSAFGNLARVTLGGSGTMGETWSAKPFMQGNCPNSFWTFTGNYSMTNYPCS